MKRIATIVIVLCLIVLSAAAITPVAGAKQRWTVVAGGGVAGTTVVSNSFSPRTIEVAMGDTVTWTFQRPWAFHTVTFLSGEKPPAPVVMEGDKTYENPQIAFPAGSKTYDGTGYQNSGAPPDPTKPFSYSLTFTKAGTFEYRCMYHAPGMSGTVVVKDRVSASPAAVAAQGRRDLAATLKAGQAAFAKWEPERQGNTVVLPLIGDPKAGWSILRVSQKPVVVDRGTTVTWTMRDPMEIHAVTFPTGQKALEFIIVQPQRQGPPKLLWNPKIVAPTTSKTYDGTSYANSGILFPPGAPGNLPTSFSLTFTKPGRYGYACVIHATEGMSGMIVVK